MCLCAKNRASLIWRFLEGCACGGAGPAGALARRYSCTSHAPPRRRPLRRRPLRRRRWLWRALLQPPPPRAYKTWLWLPGSN